MTSGREASLERLLEDSGPFSRTAYKNLRSGLEKDTPELLGSGHHTRHAFAHADRTIALLGALVSSETTKRPLDPAEAFVLLAATVLYDIGYGRMPAEDAEASVSSRAEVALRALESDRTRLGLRNAKVAQVVGHVLRLQRRDAPALEAARKPVRIGGQTIRVGFLAGLLALADALGYTYQAYAELPARFLISMPSDLAARWRAGKLIQTVNLDWRARAIVLRGACRGQKEREQVAQQLGYLQGELERALPNLLEGGVVLLSVTGRFDGDERIDARELATHSVATEQDKLETFLDLRTTYRINVIRRADCEVARTVQFVNSGAKAIESRRHFFYSDSSFFLGQEEPVKAWSGSRRLRVRMQHTAPARIEFDIVFPRRVKPGEAFTYTYEIFWPDCFPAEDEFFTGNDFGLSVRFELVMPSGYRLVSIECAEIRPDGQQVTLVPSREMEPQPLGEHRKEYVVEVTKHQRSSNTRLSWRWERPPLEKHPYEG